MEPGFYPQKKVSTITFMILTLPLISRKGHCSGDYVKSEE